MTNHKILLVDTEKNVLLTYQAILEEEGYQVDTASDEQSAWEKISLENFAVVISELYLKGKKTVNLLKTIKEAHPEIYIIIITATYLDSKGCGEIIDAGVDDYFTKPLDSNALLANIKKGLKRRDLVLKNIQLEEQLNNIAPTHFTDNHSSQTSNFCENDFFDSKLQNEITRSKRYKHSFSLVVFDLEVPDIKKYPASFDKQKISKTLCQILSKITRRTDIITQNNGSFSLILVETPIAGAKNFSSRLQDEVVKLIISEELNMPHALSEFLSIQYHAFPEQSDYIQQWTTLHKK